MNRNLSLCTLAVLFTLCVPALQAQQGVTVTEIVKEATDRNDARTEKINNYTIHQTAFGMDMKVRFE